VPDGIRFADSSAQRESQTVQRPGLNAAQTYGYEGLHRLASASSATLGWAQAYEYDI